MIPTTIQPLYSVIIPAYNCATTIRRAIESVFAQDVSGLELIVVNDGSTDNTPGILSQFGDRIMVINQANQGVAGTRNNGILAARGEFIAFLDADDEWLPGKVRKQLYLFERNPQVGLIGLAAQYKNESGILEQVGTTNLQGRLLERLLFENPIVTSSVLVRRDCLLSVDRWFRDQLSGGGAGVEDWELWIRLSARYDFIINPEPLVIYYRSKNSYFNQHSVEHLRSLWEDVFQCLLEDPLLAPIVQRNWRHLQANIHFMTAYMYYELGDIKTARKEMLQAIITSPAKIHWNSAIPILLIPPSWRNFFKRMLLAHIH